METTEIKSIKEDNSSDEYLQLNLFKSFKQQQKEKLLPTTFRAFDVSFLKLKPLFALEISERLGIKDNISESFIRDISKFYRCLPNPRTLTLIDSTPMSIVLNTIINEFVSIKHPQSIWAIQSSNYSDDFSLSESLIIDCSTDGDCITVSYLSKVRKKNKVDFMSLLSIYQFLSQQCSLNFTGIDENEYYFKEQIIEMINDYEEPEKTKAFKDLKAYEKNGLATKYYNLIHSRTNVSIQDLLDITIPIPELLSWIKTLVNLDITEGMYHVQNFDYNYEDSNEENGQMVRYSNYVGFYWEEDSVFNEIDSMYEASAQQVGILNPSWSITYTENGQFGEIIDSEWPSKFHKLLTQFNNIVLPKILTYYGLTKIKDESK